LKTSLFSKSKNKRATAAHRAVKRYMLIQPTLCDITMIKSKFNKASVEVRQVRVAKTLKM